MKLLLLILLLLATLSAIILLHAEGRKMAASHPQQPLRSIKANITRKLQQKSRAALAFAQQKGFNTRFCFFADMSLHSGSSRFFVYSLTGDSVLISGLVTHGRCNEWWLDGRKYSNTKGSGCTSLGRYKVGAAYQGRFGLAYKLHGLDSSNSNAFSRYVVLHAHTCVPQAETVDEICQSDGCPTVSPGYLRTLTDYLENSSKPVLLWIFD